MFFIGTQYNPPGTSTTSTEPCVSSFDSILFAVTAENGNAAYDLSATGDDRSAIWRGQKVQNITARNQKIVLDTGLNAGAAAAAAAAADPPERERHGVGLHERDPVRIAGVQVVSAEGRLCPGCGTRAKAKWEFCPRCGESLANAAEAPRAEVASAAAADDTDAERYESAGGSWKGFAGAVAAARRFHRGLRDPAQSRPAARGQHLRGGRRLQNAAGHGATPDEEGSGRLREGSRSA